MGEHRRARLAAKEAGVTEIHAFKSIRQLPHYSAIKDSINSRRRRSRIANGISKLALHGFTHHGSGMLAAAGAAVKRCALRRISGVRRLALSAAKHRAMLTC